MGAKGLLESFNKWLLVSSVLLQITSLTMIKMIVLNYYLEDMLAKRLLVYKMRFILE